MLRLAPPWEVGDEEEVVHDENQDVTLQPVLAMIVIPVAVEPKVSVCCCYCCCCGSWGRGHASISGPTLQLRVLI